MGIRTYSALSLLWGQRVLSHSWGDAWGGGHPVDPDDEATAGVVLLTDGADNACSPDDSDCTANDVVLASASACGLAKARGMETSVPRSHGPQRGIGRPGRCTQRA